MRRAYMTIVRAAGVSALALAVLAGLSTYAGAQGIQTHQKGTPPKGGPPPATPAEMQAISKINAAPDWAAKLQAAGEYVKAFGQSPRRVMVARDLGGKIAEIVDPAEQIAQAEAFLTIFTAPPEVAAMNNVLVDAYIKANRFDDAFRVAAAQIEKSPNEVGMLTRFALIGVNQARAQNRKFLPQSIQYGTKAIELIEADSKPPAMNAAQWPEYKATWLPQLYQNMALASIMTQNYDDARAKIAKTVALTPNDPIPYFYHGIIVNQEYQQLAEKHKNAAPGPAKDEALKQAEAKMDEVIDMFARVVALAEGNPQLQTLQSQILQELTTYYKYRHKGSTDGMQELIAKYKKVQ